MIFLKLLFLAFFTVVTHGNKTVKDNSERNLTSDNGCECQGYTCNCCVHIDWPAVKINDTGCLTIGVDTKDYGVFAYLVVDNTTLINETISVRHPIPICLGIPELEHELAICVQFTHLNVSSVGFSGCAELELRLFHLFVPADIHLGCWDTHGLPSSIAEKIHIKTLRKSNAVVWIANSTSSAKEFFKNRLTGAITKLSQELSNIDKELLHNASQAAKDLLQKGVLNPTGLDEAEIDFISEKFQNGTKSIKDFFGDNFENIKNMDGTIFRNGYKRVGDFVNESEVAIKNGFDKVGNFFNHNVLDYFHKSANTSDTLNYSLTTDSTIVTSVTEVTTSAISNDTAIEPEKIEDQSQDAGSAVSTLASVIIIVLVISVLSVGSSFAYFQLKRRQPYYTITNYNNGYTRFGRGNRRNEF